MKTNLPPAERVAMFESAGIDQAPFFLQQLNDVLVSILRNKNEIQYKSYNLLLGYRSQCVGYYMHSVTRIGLC